MVGPYACERGALRRVAPPFFRRTTDRTRSERGFGKLSSAPTECSTWKQWAVPKKLQFKMRKITGLHEGVECETRRLLATLPQRDLEAVARFFETLDGARAGTLHT